MLLPIRLICSSKKMRTDGTSLVFIQYCFSSGKKTLLNTGIPIPPGYWNKKLQRVSENLPQEYGKSSLLNKELHRQLRLAEDIINYGFEHGKDSVKFAKEVFRPDFELSSLRSLEVNTGFNPLNTNLYYQFEAYIESKKDRVAGSTLNVYNEVKRYLMAYEEYSKGKITFDCFDLNFYDDFTRFLTYEYRSYRYKKNETKGLKVNTIGKAIKHLRLFLNDRIRRKIIPPMDLSMFRSMEELSDAIYLTNTEIEKIASTELSGNALLEAHKDLFVLGCLTGLRFSDFSTLQSNDVRNKTLYIKQQKSGHWVVVPLRERAEYILRQKFQYLVPVVSNSEFNASLKVIGRLAGIDEPIRFSHRKGNKAVSITKPKYEWITSHTCRRSFCTNEFLAGTPAELIMKISGHKSLKDFYRYIKVTPEQAAEKIKEIWACRGELK
ncbi:MAG: site-specific integrase [Chitinophagaceae bacterium]